MKQTAVMIVENKVEAEAIALFDGELTFSEFMYNINKHFNRAKAMEKQQIIEAYEKAHEDGYHFEGSASDYEAEGLEKHLAEQYYNETFKSE